MNYTCKKCGHEGPSCDFRTPHKKGKDKHDYYDYCKICHRDGARASRYKAIYNITVEEYEKILKLQNEVCAICGKPPKENKRLAVDHCHKSGLIRGLLCWGCNKAIGAFKDDQMLIWMSFVYLFSSPAEKALGEKRYGVIGRVKKKAKNRKLGGEHLEDHTVDPYKFTSYISKWVAERAEN